MGEDVVGEEDVVSEDEEGEDVVWEEGRMWCGRRGGCSE